MSTSNTLVLNRIFNRSTYQSLIAGKQENSYLAAIERYVINPEKKNNRELISDIYKVIEKRQGIKISAPEEISYHKGWINKEELLASAKKYGKSPCGERICEKLQAI